MPYYFRQPDSAFGSGEPGAGLWFDTNLTAISTAYDLRNRGVILTLTPNTAGAASATHWWLDWETKSLWRIVFGSTTMEPFCLHSRRNFIAASAAHSTVMFGCRDGYVRRLENTANSDDGSTFESFVWFGPFGDPTMFNDSVIAELVGVLAKKSGEVLWSIHCGDTPEDAFTANAREQGIWTAGRNNAQHPRARGQAMYLKLTSTDATGWGYESAYLILVRAGRTRV